MANNSYAARSGSAKCDSSHFKESIVKKIAFVQSDLRVGGIQKSVVNIIRGMDYTKYKVDLYVFEDGSFFDLPENENLRIIRLKPYPGICRVIPFGLLYRLFPIKVPDEEYDVAIDFNSYQNSCACAALRLKAKKHIMWIHNDMEIKLREEPKYKIMWLFFKGKFKHFDEFVAVSPGIIDGFRKMTGITDKPVHAIPNHIDTDEIFAKMDTPIEFEPDPDEFNLCSMGRLCHQKGFDILLNYLAEVKKTRPEMHLYILGEGPDRDALTNQAQQLGISDSFTLLGNQSNPFPYLKKMDAFVLTSRYEGQGMVLWEAKAVGLPLYAAANLGKYNPGIECCDDIAAALTGAQKTEKKPDPLTQYNLSIDESLYRIFESNI